MDQLWKGYVNPYRSHECGECRGDGLSKELRHLADTFYDLKHHHGGPNGYRGTERWCDKITQEEVNMLVDEGRLHDFGCQTRVTDDDGKFIEWKRVLNDDGTPYYPTAEEVNEWQRGRGMGHDGLNRWKLINFRAEKAGIVDDLAICLRCKGEGCFWPSEQIKKQHENFCGNDETDEPGDPSIGAVWTEPPEGEGWQMWETVSEGSPVSPVFETPDGLVDWLCSPAAGRDRASRAAAEKFVKSGWVPTMMTDGNRAYVGVESAVLQSSESDS
jgi:hypothetical protein